MCNDVAYRLHHRIHPSDCGLVFGMNTSMVDWPKILQRYARIHEHIASYPDDDESAALLELCDRRDRLLAAVRSNNAESIFAAMKNSNIIPGRYMP